MTKHHTSSIRYYKKIPITKHYTYITKYYEQVTRYYNVLQHITKHYNIYKTYWSLQPFKSKGYSRLQNSATWYNNDYKHISTDYTVSQHITTYNKDYKLFDLRSRSQADAHLWVFLAIRPCEKGRNNIGIRPQDANFGILNYIHDYGSLF